MAIILKYIDPSDTIRSVPASPNDSAFCLLLGHCAVRAGISGRTNMVGPDAQRGTALGLNADQYAAEMRAQLAEPVVGAA